MQANGGFRVDRVPLNFLIELAYNVKASQVLGGPSWANSDRYDVIAKAEGDATFEQMRPMLQAMLAERFKLKLRLETRQFPVYELAVAKGGLKNIAKEGSCITFDPNSPPLPFDPNRTTPPLNICGRMLFPSGADMLIKDVLETGAGHRPPAGVMK